MAVVIYYLNQISKINPNYENDLIPKPLILKPIPLPFNII